MTKLDLILKRADIRFWKVLAFAAVTLLMFVPASVDAAVTVTSFSAKAQATQIVLTWKTVSEVNNAGFNLYRSTSLNGPWTTKINSSLIPAQCPICIVSNKTYNYNDTAVAANQTYYYKLASVDMSGGSQQFGPVSATLAQAALPTPTATNANTSTPVPLPTNNPTNVPDGNPTGAPTGIPTVLSTGTPLSSLTPGTSPAAPGTVSSPTVRGKVARPSASSTPDAAIDALESPTPGVTLVALGIKHATPEPDVASSLAETNDPAATSDSTRAYYFFRLVDATLLLTVGTLILGSFLLGALSLYFFLRAYQR